jgi:hypothetical protein
LVLTGLLGPLVPGQAEGQISWPGQNDLRPGTITNNRHAAARQETTFRNLRDPQLRVIYFWLGHSYLGRGTLTDLGSGLDRPKAANPTPQYRFGTPETG